MTSYTYSSVTDPAADPGFNDVKGINNSGEVVGYFGSGGTTYGYIDDSGAYTTLYYQPPQLNYGPDTVATAITNGGIVLGAYTDEATYTNDLLYENGSFTDLSLLSIDFTGAAYVNDSGVVVAGGTLLNSVGDVGTMIDPVLAVEVAAHGISDSGEILGADGIFTPDSVSSDTWVSTASAQWSSSTTYSKGDVVIDQAGYYQNSYAYVALDNNFDDEPSADLNNPNNSHWEMIGFVGTDWLVFGHTTVLTYPDSVSTEADFINASGEVVGDYTDSAGHSQYFIYDNGTYTPITPPAGVSTSGIVKTTGYGLNIVGINASGTILGDYEDSSYTIHNFTYSNGVYSPVDAPSNLGAGFTVAGINDVGQIIGNTDSGSYLLTPTSASIFTSGADVVNFNALTTSQSQAVTSGANIYDGLGGNDVVTLPNIANYNESVGVGAKLDWDNSADQPFSTDSNPGDTYTVRGGNGDYYIDAGAGNDNITISGGGTSYVTAGTGTFGLAVSGGGEIVLAIADGSTASGSATIGVKSEIAIGGSASATVTFGGSAGTLLLDDGDLETGSLSIPSSGLVSGTGTLSATVTNAGTLEGGANRVLDVDGNIANSKWIEAIGEDAEIDIEGNVDNTFAGLIFASGSGAHVNLEGSVVSGGTLETISGGVINVGDPTGGAAADVTLDGTGASNPVNNTGTLVVTDGSTLDLTGIVNNTGEISLAGDSNETDLKIVGSSFALQGNGKVSLSDSDQNQIISDGSPTTLTNLNNTIAGAGGIGDDNLTLINDAQGVIDGGYADNALTLDTAGAITNSGTLQGTAAGGLVISADVNNSKLIEAIGTDARVLIEADVTNATSGLILASGAGAHVDLVGSTVSGGTLKTAGGGVINIGDPVSGTAADITLYGTGADPVNNSATIVVDDGSTLRLDGVINNTGNISLAGDTAETDLEIVGSFSLRGLDGEVALSDSDQNQIISDNASATLTNVNNTISGAGTIGDDNLTLINDAQGVVDGGYADNALTLGTAGAITNSGTLEGTAAGGLVISADVDNSKLIEAIGTDARVLIEADVSNTTSGLVLASGAGAHVDLDDAVISGGTLRTADGALIQTVSASTDNAVSGATVAAGSLIEVTDATELTLSGTVVDSGTIAAITSGADLEVDGVLKVAAGGLVSGATIESGGTAIASSGGRTVSATIESGGTMLVSAGGTDTSASIDVGGTEIVLSHGAAIAAMISGSEIISAAGVASGATIEGGGTATVSSGGTDAGATIDGGGTEIVLSRGIDIGANIGGVEIVSAGGTAFGVRITGGAQNVHGYASGAAIAAGSQTVFAGGTASATTVSNGGTLTVSSGGSAAATTILNGGTEVVGSHGTDSGAKISNGGALSVGSGGTSVNATVSSGGTVAVYGSASGVTVLSAGNLTVASGGVASGTHVSSGGTEYVLANGLDRGATLIGGAEVVSSGGLASAAVVSRGGNENIFGSAVSTTVLSGGSISVEAGGVASATRVSAGGTDNVLAAGQDNSAVLVGGTQFVSSGGTASGTIISTGTEIVSAGGTEINAKITGGSQFDYGLASGDIVSAGSQIVEAGGTASQTTVSKGGVLVVSSGGLLVLSGGTINAGATVSATSGGTAVVSGVAIDSAKLTWGGVTSIGTGATLETASGGTALLSSTVSNSGTLFASGAASLLEIASGATVTGGGSAEVGNGIVDIQAGDEENVTFLSGGTGGLELEDSQASPVAYGGTVSGFGQNIHQFIDLTAVASASRVTLGYTSVSSSGGTLTVSSGGQLVASIAMSGGYTSANFHLTSGTGGTVEIFDPPIAAVGTHTANIALLGNYMAASFVTAAGGFGGAVIAEEAQTPPQPLLTQPHAG